ncbi:MAG: AAA family ATPase [Kofleriaceae bacterium]|nr:AAA family ATPase [Kofleriaceae bacterium]
MLAAIGVICLDELDKIASGQNNAIFAGAGTTKDVTGMGVQRELLKMLEASEVVVPLELGHASYADRRDVDRRHRVRRLRRVLRLPPGGPPPPRQGVARLRPHPVAGADPDAIAVGFTAEQVDNVANFQAYGFLPELIARFTRVVPFAALDAATLKGSCASTSSPA